MKFEPWAQRTLDNLPTNRRRDVQGFLQVLSDDGVTQGTQQIYIRMLKTLDGSKSYKQQTEGDIRAWARVLDASYAPETAALYKLKARKFLTWIHRSHLNGQKYPPCVRWIKRKRDKANYGGEVLTPAEIKSLIGAASNQRNRALLFLGYEAGLRASELTNLKIKDIEFDQFGAILRINGKTGQRRVRVHDAAPDLLAWVNLCPHKGNSEAPLWPSQKTRTRPIKRRTLTALVKKCAKNAGLTKRISPHSLRHARCTHLCGVLREPQLRVYFGWSPNSKTPSRYVHLSGADLDSDLFEYWGIKPREDGDQEGPLKAKVCSRCSTENSATARFCWRCWAAFDTAKSEELTAKALEVLMGMVDPAQFREKLKEKGIDQEIKKLVQGGNGT